MTLVALSLAALIYFLKEDQKEQSTLAYSDVIPDEWLENNGEILTPEEDRRMADQTYLTFPEWYLVFAPTEQAQFMKKQTSTNFAFSEQVDQFYAGYDIISERIDGKFPYNEEYNTMIEIIGTSTAVEYKAKSWYETVIGRMTNYGALTEEDQFYQRYMERYSSSLHDKAWYEFDYANELKSLWTETDFFGWNMPRKLERKYLLTSEFILKMLYAKIIKKGSQSMYG